MLNTQEFNLEKLQLLEQEKAKIRKEYERREGQVEVKKKMWVKGLLLLWYAWLGCPLTLLGLFVQ